MNNIDSLNNPSDEMEEIWALFAEDGKEALDTAEDDLLALESDPANVERIAELFRGMHTFKGNARVMGLSTIETLAHYAEDLIALVRDDGVTLDSPMIDLLLTALDKLRALLKQVLASRRDVSAAETESLTAQLQAMKAAYTAPPPPPAEIAPIEPPPAAETDPLPEFERVDPAADPIYVQIFIELAQEEFSRFLDALNDLSAGNDEAVAEITGVADTLHHAAEQMGYHRFQTELDELVEAATQSSGEERIEQLTQARIQLEALLAEYAGELSIQVKDTPKSSVDWQASVIDEAAAREFLVMAHRELNRLHNALNALPENGDEQETVQRSREAIEALQNSARQLGYERIAAVLDNLTAGLEMRPGPARLVILQDIELALYEELSVVQEAAQLPEAGGGDADPGFGWLFGHWHAENVFANLSRLREIVDEPAAFGPGNTEIPAGEAVRLLRDIYHSCVFYKLIQATHLSLALEDLYARIAQGEMAVSETLLTLTRTYVTQLGGAIDAVREGETPNTAGLEAMIPQVEEVLFLQTENQTAQITRSMLDALNIPPEFKEAVTPESLAKIDLALKAGRHFYTILTNMNRDETTFNAFYNWAQADTIDLITNVTVYQDNRSLFKFLLTSNQPQADILAALTKIDPEGQHLFLNELDLNVAGRSLLVEQNTAPRAAAGLEQIDFGANIDDVAGFMEIIGKLLTTHAALHRLTEKLAGMDLAQFAAGLVKRNGDDQSQLAQDLQTTLRPIDEDLKSLEQLEIEIGGTLGQLHEMALDVNTHPAAILMEPLAQEAEKLARQQGKSVQLDMNGGDVKLTRDAINALYTPATRLLQWAITGIEKPAGGHLLMSVNEQNGGVKFAVKTDGVVSAAENGNPADDIRAALQAHQGRLTVTDRAEDGAQFALTLPLERVVVDGMVARVGQVPYIGPVEAVRRIIKPEKTAVVHASVDGGQTLLKLEEEMVPIQQLAGGAAKGHLGERLLLVVERNEQLVALAVDEVIGQQQVLVRSLQGYLANVRGVSGCALLSNGEVGMMLDMA